MELGKWPQWQIKKEEMNTEIGGEYFEIGINDVAYINDNEEKRHAYINWEQHKNDIYYFKSTPIVWRILDETEDTLFVLSEYSIECKQFNEKEEPVVWESSSLRKWLNEVFFEQAFTEDEKECIIKKEIYNEYNPINQIDGGAATKDKVFLLSYRDVLNVKYGFEGYITSSVTREAKNTDWAKVMGALTNPEQGMGWWWLRSPAMEYKSSGRVDYSGYIYFIGKPVTMFGSVRPAMYLDKKKVKKLNLI